MPDGTVHVCRRVRVPVKCCVLIVPTENEVHKFSVLVFSDFAWLRYVQIGEMSSQVGALFDDVGEFPSRNLSVGARAQDLEILVYDHKVLGRQHGFQRFQVDASSLDHPLALEYCNIPEQRGDLVLALAQHWFTQNAVDASSVQFSIGVVE